MVCEIRVCEAMEGRGSAMRGHFQKKVVPRFASHGVELAVAVFAFPSKEARLTYLIFVDEQTHNAIRASRAADPACGAVKATSVINGTLLEDRSVWLLASIMAGLLHSTSSA